MKKNCISTLIKGGWICGCIICMASCGPVHRFTRIKNVPREYMRNYSIEGVKAPRNQTLPKHTPWIVFANEAGTTYLSPSGKNEMQSVKYMDAFLVIKRKGDWLRVIQPPSLCAYAICRTAIPTLPQSSLPHISAPCRTALRACTAAARSRRAERWSRARLSTASSR